MTRLIVHADDFGLSEKINDGILHAHRHGIVTSASIMANGEAFDHAVALALSTPTLDVGIHLTLIEEKPVVCSTELPSLVDAEGRLHPHAIQFCQRYFSGRIHLKEVRRELEAQTERVLAAGLIPSHFDSHQHMHMLPQVLSIVLDLSRKYHIPSIRLPREHVVPGAMGSSTLNRAFQALALNVFCRMANGKIAQRADSFAGFLYGGNLNKVNLLNLLKHLPRAGTCEIMCHPGLEDQQSRYAHWRYHWSEELNALVDSEIKQVVRSKSIQLISYRDLNLS